MVRIFQKLIYKHRGSMIRILKKLIYKHQGSIGSWPITEPGPATHGWKNFLQKMHFLFVITEPGPATHGWKNFSHKMHLFFVVSRDPSKKNRSEITRNPR